MRTWITTSLKIGALLLVVLIVSGCLWGLLQAVGDQGAAQAVVGVALVALVCWMLDFVVLVVLLAFAFLSSTEEAGE